MEKNINVVSDFWTPLPICKRNFSNDSVTYDSWFLWFSLVSPKWVSIGLLDHFNSQDCVFGEYKCSVRTVLNSWRQTKTNQCSRHSSLRSWTSEATPVPKSQEYINIRNVDEKLDTTVPLPTLLLILWGTGQTVSLLKWNEQDTNDLQNDGCSFSTSLNSSQDISLGHNGTY